MASKELIRSIQEVAYLLQSAGWAEKNAGNITVNITEVISKRERNSKASREIAFTRTYPGLSLKIFLATISGSRMRDVAQMPEDGLCLITINGNGSACSVRRLSRMKEPFQPTSELPTHLAIHEKLAAIGSANKAVLHTHPTELIALTHFDECGDEEQFNKLTRSLHPEVVVLNPKGVGYIPYILPGSEKIAEMTANAFGKRDIVVWAKHGCIAAGRNTQEAFDVIDIMNKSAKIYLLCKSAGVTPKGFSDEEIEELERVWGGCSELPNGPHLQG
jgi:rhamnulose-1-phosphate aldolase